MQEWKHKVRRKDKLKKLRRAKAKRSVRTRFGKVSAAEPAIPPKKG